MRPTTLQERMDLMAEVAEVKRDTIREWSNVWSAEGERLNGVPIRLRWYEDGTAVVEVDGVPALRVAVEITVHPVEFQDATNKPTGFVMRRTWSTVPAGWFVRDPKGQWWEILAAEATPAGQSVTMRMYGNGVHGTWTRDPEGEVSARRGALSPQDRDEAMEALGSVFQTRILEDEGPMQS